MEKDRAITKIFFEKNSLSFILCSSYILAKLLVFYQFPWYFIFIWVLILYILKAPKIFVWVLSLTLFYFFSQFYWQGFETQKSINLNPKAELLTRIQKIEPYYNNYYLVWGYNTLVGNFIFKTTHKNFFKPGEICLIKFEAKNFKEYFNPFYVEKYKRSFVKGIEKELIMARDNHVVCNSENGFNLEYIRYKLLNFSQKLSPISKGLFQALVLGTEYNLPEEYLEKLKNQGLYHQLAISGFNLAILFTLFYRISFFIIKHTPFIKSGYPLQNIAYVLGLPGAFLILLFSGFCPSALRAFVFLALFILSKLFFRETSSLIILTFTAILILIFQPYLIGNLSFQLSFLAAFGLIIGDRLFKFYFKNKFNNIKFSKIFKYLFYSVFISLIVSLFIFPVLIYINGNFPVGIIFNNILATFFWSFIFIPLSIVIAIFSFLNEHIAISLGNVLGYLFNFYIKIPFFEIIYKPSIPVNIFLIFFCFMALIFLFLNLYISNNYKRYIIFISLSVIFYLILHNFYRKICYIFVFDTGKANAFLIKDRDSYIMIDAGPNYGQFNWTKIYLEPVLNKLGVDKLDLVIISHPDKDHSGGLNTILKDFYVKKCLSGNFYLRDWDKIKPVYFPEVIDTPQGMKINDSEFFIFPGKRPYKSLNRESLVVYLEHKGLTVLFPGDIDKKRFYRMKREGEILPIEILISPHHGSKNGLDKEILNWLKPEVVITSGRGKYHPYKNILTLLKNLKIKHYITSEKGAIYIFPKDDYFLVCFEKTKRKYFWSSVLFPFIPVYLESDNFCKKFAYYKDIY